MKKGYFIILFLLIVSYSYAQDTSTSSVQIPQTNTLNKSKEIKGFEIYPNPVSNGVLRINTLKNMEKTVQIFDVLGKQVFLRTTKTKHLNVSMLNSGIYIIRVSEQGKTATRKLVIK